MTWTLAESLVDDLIAYFGSNFAAILAAIDAEIDDGITLANMTSWEMSEQMLDEVQSWPRGVVLVGNTRAHDWRGGNIKGLHDVTIGILVLDQDKTNLRKRIYRYGRAVMEQLDAAHGDNAFTWDVSVGGVIDINFSPLFTTGDKQFVADVQIGLTFQKMEAIA